MSMSVIVKVVCNYSCLSFWGGIVALALFHKYRRYKLCAWWITLRVYEQRHLLLIKIWDIQAFSV